MVMRRNHIMTTRIDCDIELAHSSFSYLVSEVNDPQTTEETGSVWIVNTFQRHLRPPVSRSKYDRKRPPL